MPSRKVDFNALGLQTEAELQKFLESSFTESLRQLIRVTVKVMIKTEMEEFRKEMHDLVGTIHFNGSYDRQLVGPFGSVENIPVPRFRDNPTTFTPETLSVFAEEKDKFMAIMAEMHRLGISERKIDKLARTCFNTKVTPAKLGAVYRELADQEVFKVNSTPLADDFEYLFADGLWVKAKGYGWDNNDAVILCVLGVKTDGSRAVVGFDVVRGESYESWQQLLLSIKQRGLTGKNLKLITSDDGPGFVSAIHQLFPNTPHQNCIAHKMRNVITKTKRKNKKAMGEDLSVAFNQETKEQTLLQIKAMCKKWYLTEPKAIESLKYHIAETLTYFDFDPKVWHQIRTNNILEREFREVRRRIKVMDNSFNSTESTTRYAGSIINYLNQNYPAKRNPKLHTQA
jgi:transposase-like protein